MGSENYTPVGPAPMAKVEIPDARYYRESIEDDGCDKCEAGRTFTIVSKDADGADVAIGTSWADEDLCCDVCDLMNMAYEAGWEAHLARHTETNELYIAEGVKRRAADDRVTVLEAAIKKAVSECDACGGKGFEVMDDGHGDIDKDPCNSCWDFRELILDHTDYTLPALETEAPASSAVGPTGTCLKNDYCLRGDGHEGACDDGIPF